MADTGRFLLLRTPKGNAHVTLQLAFPQQAATTLLPAITAITVITAIIAIIAITAITMESNKEHIEALLKDLTPQSTEREGV
ncbi:hypothetical protein E4U13_002581 [Claviceps humidiphila]|uniref:Uncharacterized protein n=1 Tax=Claviceps humidiphila TaxID=1294629 RepID=A0A9P7Q0W0_9HYPO|nr:hypothetical protein E4U13_002581 [Claviceps humidiphila]